MANLKLDLPTIIKLAVWSLIVGGILYWLEWSPGQIYGFIIDKFAGIWDWMVGSGLQYMLLGATIVVPVFIISRLRAGRKN